MTSYPLYVVVLLLIVVKDVIPHSWIACTDYLEENGEYWDKNKCRAFPRHGHKFTPKDSFGQDTGYNIHNPANNAPCRTAYTANGGYTSDYPMPVYYPGQRVVIAHPTKNHVAEVGCTNKYIPDKGNFIWRSGKDPSFDPSLRTFKQNVVADLGVSPVGHSVPDAKTKTYPKMGFQNAPKFCEDKDKALGTYAFNISQNLQPGRYIFMWGWYFNSLTDLYTTCWDVEVVSDASQRDFYYQQLNQPTGNAGGQNTGGSTEGSTGGGSNTGGSTDTTGGSDSGGNCNCQCPSTGTGTNSGSGTTQTNADVTQLCEAFVKGILNMAANNKK